MTKKRWLVAGSVLAVLLVVAFAAFRPDKLFVDEVVQEDLDSDVEAALKAASESTATEVPTPPTSDPVEGNPPVATTQTTLPPVLGQGQFVAQTGHDVVGSAFVVDRSGTRLLVLPDLDSENGPDLQLYLSPDSSGSVDGGIKIAPLKGNQGTQSYELPPEVDLAQLANVVIWCERFRLSFATATLV